jgi:uncharacterized SAM-binding protein YcdF (DUF218 family)
LTADFADGTEKFRQRTTLSRSISTKTTAPIVSRTARRGTTMAPAAWLNGKSENVLFNLAPAARAAFCDAMFFWLKKFLGFWLMPLPFCLLLLVAGLWLMRTTRRARLGRALAIAGVGLLVLLSNKIVSVWLVRPLETRYPAIPEIHADAVPPALAACRYVVVLGSGNGNSPGLSATNQLSASALARLTEAVRLLRVLPDAKMIVSGPAEGTHASHATMLARAAESLGVDRARIVYIDRARDTEEESLAVRPLVGEAPFALVTSAWHMPRAMALFRHSGLNPLPCPADFTSHGDDDLNWSDFFWETASLERSTWAVRERLGYVWIWLRGKG